MPNVPTSPNVGCSLNCKPEHAQEEAGTVSVDRLGGGEWDDGPMVPFPRTPHISPFTRPPAMQLGSYLSAVCVLHGAALAPQQGVPKGDLAIRPAGEACMGRDVIV